MLVDNAGTYSLTRGYSYYSGMETYPTLDILFSSVINYTYPAFYTMGTRALSLGIKRP